jgi:hypothetical protein
MYLIFVRVFWMVLGPAILIISAASIFSSSSGWMTFVDAVFVVTVVGMIAARLIDFQSGDSRDAFGEPVSAPDIRRYCIVLAAAGCGVWVLANVVGNHLR